MKQQFGFLFLCLLLTTLSYGQEAGKEKKDELKREFNVDLRAHGSGFAIGGDVGFILNDRTTLVGHLQIASLKHHREIKQDQLDGQPRNSGSKPYIYGKQNSFYGLHFGIGGKYYLSEKAKRRAVAVALVYSGGPSLGLVKPYYLNLNTDDNWMTPPVAVRYSEGTRADFIDIQAIRGAAGFTNGMGEINVIGGLYGQTGINFDWGARHSFLKSIEVGLMVDGYFKEVPIMIPEIQDNKALFVNLYIALQLGKRM